MGDIRYGPSGLPEAPTFEESFAALSADGYRACEIGFVSGFWLDYETAPLFAAAAAAADVYLSVHAPLAAFMGHADRGKKFKMALGMLDHTAGLAQACGARLIVFHPGFLLGREREQAIADVVDQLALERWALGHVIEFHRSRGAEDAALRYEERLAELTPSTAPMA